MLEVKSLSDLSLDSWAPLTWLLFHWQDYEIVPFLPVHPNSLLYLLILYKCEGLLIALLEADATPLSRVISPDTIREYGPGHHSNMDVNTRFEIIPRGEESLLERAVAVKSPKIAEALLRHGADANIHSARRPRAELLRLQGL